MSRSCLGISFRTCIMISKWFRAFCLMCSKSFSVNLLGKCKVSLASGRCINISQKTSVLSTDIYKKI